MIGNTISEDLSKPKSPAGGTGPGHKTTHDEALLGMKFPDEVNKPAPVIGLPIGLGVFRSLCANTILSLIPIKGNPAADVYTGGPPVV